MGVMNASLVVIGFAGIVPGIETRQVPTPPADPGARITTGPDATPLAPARRLLLPAVLVLALLRGYSGPALHDWPFVRGVDHYSHARSEERRVGEEWRSRWSPD